MASGNHVCKIIWADLPTAPINNRIDIKVNPSIEKPKIEKARLFAEIMGAIANIIAKSTLPNNL